MDAGDQVVAGNRLPQRVPDSAAVRVLRTHRQEHLDHARVVAQAIDLLRRKRRDLARHDQRHAQPRVTLHELGDLPIVDGAGQGHRGVGVVQAVDRVQAVQDGVLDTPRVERTLLQAGEPFADG